MGWYSLMAVSPTIRAAIFMGLIRPLFSVCYHGIENIASELAAWTSGSARDAITLHGIVDIDFSMVFQIDHEFYQKYYLPLLIDSSAFVVFVIVSRFLDIF